MSENRMAKAGKLLCVDSGEYSDYSVHGFFVVLRDFEPMTELGEHLSANPEQRQRYKFKQDSYLATLLAKGLLMEVEFGTLYLGTYSSFDALNFTPAS